LLSAGEDPEDAVEPGGEADAADDYGAPARRGVARHGAGAAPAAAAARGGGRQHHPAAQGDEPPPPPAWERRRLLRLLPLQQQRRQRQPPELLLELARCPGQDQEVSEYHFSREIGMVREELGVRSLMIVL
jgi:hypothetical protein